MEKIFVDTSAIYALIGEADQYHASAGLAWEGMVERGELLISNNYVLVECFALIQNRLGLEFARVLHANLVPFLQIDWIDETLHLNSAKEVFAFNRRQLSLVDCSSFETMRRLGIEKVFTFDGHFREQGFEVIP